MSRILPFLKGLSRRLPGHDWAEQLDFAGPRVRTAGWSWAVLGAGVLALLVVADQGEAQQQSTAEAQAQLKRLSKADRALRLERAAKAEVRGQKNQALAMGAAAAASAPEVPVPPQLNDQTLSEAVAMATLMAYPWPEVLRDVSQRAMDHKVVLTAFSLDLSGWDAGAQPVPAARLQAAVMSDEVALRWAADLPEGQLKTRSSLQTPFTGPWGSFALKAEVQARWAAGGQP